MSITGSCHCGKTSFRIDGEIPAALTRCTCSFCAKRGALLAYYPVAQFHVTSADADDAVYRWQTKLRILVGTATDSYANAADYSCFKAVGRSCPRRPFLPQATAS